MPLALRLSSIILGWWFLSLATVQTVGGLRCFVCGGHSGTPCRGGVGWAQDINNNNHQLETEMTAQDPVQECTDLINNRGCVKQFVNGVVLLRGCWLDGSNKCLKNGAAEVCTCSSDLCNSSSRTVRVTGLALLLLTTAVSVLL